MFSAFVNTGGEAFTENNKLLSLEPGGVGTVPLGLPPQSAVMRISFFPPPAWA